eukprot:CAMPEP_0171041612 /NCGR_PEP_ID=MMETSP0736-20130129/45696_1 /TAXON_ID=186038 /ORGANISM="Fragilariopsis kerguelensis, Strain L26-C5" /LENGTH=52 /DNA_ID=CAMNT_0011489801 /DNA_START=204 /DNA_END=359 /DNA_ORIENTATION=+
MNGLGLSAVVCSPNNRQFIVWSDDKEGDNPPGAITKKEIIHRYILCQFSEEG